jgi:acylphosphatase
MKKVELIIKGQKVHDIGYRPFLLQRALERGIGKIFAFNSHKNAKKIVVVRAEGDEEIIGSFIEYITANYPNGAQVDEIEQRDFSGPLDDAYQYMMLLQFEQISKAVPAILSLDRKQDIMIGKQDVMIEKQDVMIEKQDVMIEKQDTTIGILRSVRDDTSAIREDISCLRKDTLESLQEKYNELSIEVAEIKATLAELKAKAS